MATVRQNLRLQFSGEIVLDLAQMPVVACHAEISQHESNEGQQSRIARRRIPPRRRQADHLIAEAVGNLVVGRLIDVVQQHGRVRQPGNQTPADNGRLPGNATARSMPANPFQDEVNGLIARFFGFCRHKVAQPAEAVQLTFPFLAGWLEIERRPIADVGHSSAEPELTNGNFVSEARVSRPQILRNDQQLIGNRRPEAPTQQP